MQQPLIGTGQGVLHRGCARGSWGQTCGNMSEKPGGGMFVAKQWSDAGGSEELACTRDMSRRAQRRDITPATFLFTQIRQAHRQIFMKMNED
eukprot:CAMPEP_0174375620 /NCGR_PEP_ID=MMETSP0811_2-20130205/115298_1 /TAXON_ID=73025 ORGANISM="Eutreptiella gymnastica-like, Strain CCMP1594" /NCGR_SAMPLE_ID=MMETSP0811_2 /ASSEMBLY_ACC=CAM_ASM_000667 /LENGTH=91 /DNA_ID=CAMNT_0015526063 /DNA_START=178 /DNA_END=450 /DNA_ORIENTATION=+